MTQLAIDVKSPKSGRALSFPVYVPSTVQAFLEADGEAKVYYNICRQFKTDVLNKARAMMDNRKKNYTDAQIIAACTKLRLAAGEETAEEKASKLLAKLDPAVVAALKALHAPKTEEAPKAEDEPKTEEAPKA